MDSAERSRRGKSLWRKRPLHRRGGPPTLLGRHHCGGPERRGVITDAPFSETRGQLRGFFPINAGDLDDAIRPASKIPPAPGSVEVRPIRSFGRSDPSKYEIDRVSI